MEPNFKIDFYLISPFGLVRQNTPSYCSRVKTELTYWTLGGTKIKLKMNSKKVVKLISF
jgi:hypothetical protein